MINRNGNAGAGHGNWARQWLPLILKRAAAFVHILTPAQYAEFIRQLTELQGSRDLKNIEERLIRITSMSGSDAQAASLCAELIRTIETALADDQITEPMRIVR